MSCSSSSSLIGRVAGRLGIAWLGSKSGYTSGSTAQVSFFDPQPATRTTKKRLSKKSQARKTKVGSANDQISFFADNQAAASQEQHHPNERTGQSPLPTQRQIKITNDFSAEELQTISVQLRLGVAAVSRQIRELNGGALRGIGHSDPRPLDWARSDRKNFEFLVSQLDEARRGRGYLDTTALNKAELVDLWDFARFEADRAMRNIDHLQSGLSHLKGPTAEYLTGRHQLEARFYSFVAGQVETMIPPEKIEAAKAWE
ncbi:MAG: hypothetical protein KDJ65_00385 [Anaerolineae bacterium]|nr:hypothetical protein [Anaerolineae bacterium]